MFGNNSPNMKVAKKRSGATSEGKTKTNRDFKNDFATIFPATKLKTGPNNCVNKDIPAKLQ